MSNIKGSRQKAGFTLLAHIGVWLFLFLFPMFLGERFDLGSGFLRLHVLFLVMTVSIFYLNYFLFIPRFYYRKNYPAFIVYNLIGIALALVSIYFVEQGLMSEPPRFEPDHNREAPKPPGRDKPDKPHMGMMILYRNGIMLLVTVGAAVAVRVSGKWLEEENKRKLVETEHLKSEMNLLRLQLQPHFFFNTLNNIYALIEKHPQEAKDVVHKLSKLMRHVLYKSDASFIPVREELAFIKAYIDVSKVRCGPHVKVTTSFPPSEEGNGLIPPLLFISLIENAFKHGVDAMEACFINIEITLKPNRLKLVVKNSYFPKKEKDKSGSGIGIVNLEKRLGLLYNEGQFSFKHFHKEGTYHSELILMNLYE